MTADVAAHAYRETAVPVDGGDLHVGVWEPTAPVVGTVLAVHGITASHRAWPLLVDRLPGVRVIAPDLRGRGRSNALPGPSSMSRHADDLVAVLDAFDEAEPVVVGHSMGAFVSVVLAARSPERVRRLVLVDGGLPLDVPDGLSADELVSLILGPVAERLGMRFADVDAYLDFWRAHPAFREAWTPELEAYLAYDLVRDGDALRPATSYATTAEDTADLNAGTAVRDAFAVLRHPALLVSVPRGLQDEEPGLYASERLPGLLAGHDTVRHVRLDGLNHYTVVMSAAGADALAPLVLQEVAAG